MSVSFGRDYTPVYKYKQNTTVAAAAAWTPSSSTKIVMTDFLVSIGGAVAGTFQIRFGNVGGSIITTGVLAGSTTLGPISFSTPIYNPTYDQALFFETATSESSGGWTLTVAGFEQE